MMNWKGFQDNPVVLKELFDNFDTIYTLFNSSPEDIDGHRELLIFLTKGTIDAALKDSEVKEQLKGILELIASSNSHIKEREAAMILLAVLSAPGEYPSIDEVRQKGKEANQRRYYSNNFSPIQESQDWLETHLFKKVRAFIPEFSIPSSKSSSQTVPQQRVGQPRKPLPHR